MTRYKQDLGLKESVAIVISRIIGSGIFRVPASIMALVGCTSLFGVVWIIGGAITIFGAVIYAELSAMMPKSGGPYVFLKAAYGPYIAFIRGWAMFFVSETASIVAVALVFSEYISSIWFIVYGNQFDVVSIFFLSLGSFLVISSISTSSIGAFSATFFSSSNIVPSLATKVSFFLTSKISTYGFDISSSRMLANLWLITILNILG